MDWSVLEICKEDLEIGCSFLEISWNNLEITRFFKKSHHSV